MTRVVIKTVLFSIPFVAFSLALSSGCSDDDGGGNNSTAVCGNDVCDEGETAIRCPEDCGCGNGVINLVEDCDGENLGGDTCETVGYNGGVLSCAADCTFAVNRCCENQCDNFGDSRCDRTTVRQTCATRLNGCLGWEDAEDCIDNAQTCDDSSGTAVCTSECDDLCPGEGDTRCSLTVDTAIEQCVMQLYGCLNWEEEGTDCADSDDMCVDTTGTAHCCSDECTNIGQTKCTGRRIEVCGVGSMGCNEWLLDTQCPQMETCEDSGPGPHCVPIVSGDGEDCSDAWVLIEGQNTVNWTATVNNYMTSTPSCTSSAPDGPDVVLMYPASVDGHLDIWMDKPASTRYVMVVSDGLCGDLTSQVTCVSEYTATTMGTTFPITAGETYYFYIVDTTSGTNPLPNPINIYVTEIDCSTTTAGIVTLTPAHDATEVSSNSNLIVDFDQPVKPNLGVVTVTGNISTNLSYNLSTSSEVSFSNGNRRMTIDPAPLFQLTETITVTWTGMEDQLCDNPVSSPTWNFQVRATADPGENCANPIPLTAGSGSYGWLASARDYHSVVPCGTVYTLDGPDVVGSFTASATGYATITWQKPASNRMIMAVYEGNCGDLSVQLGCINDYTPSVLEFDFIITVGRPTGSTGSTPPWAPCRCPIRWTSP